MKSMNHTKSTKLACSVLVFAYQIKTVAIYLYTAEASALYWFMWIDKSNQNYLVSSSSISM